MYLFTKHKNTYWIRLSPEKEGWYGLGKNEEWIGSYPTLEVAVKEYNRLTNSVALWNKLAEEGEPLYEITELAA